MSLRLLALTGQSDPAKRLFCRPVEHGLYDAGTLMDRVLEDVWLRVVPNAAGSLTISPNDTDTTDYLEFLKMDTTKLYASVLENITTHEETLMHKDADGVCRDVVVWDDATPLPDDLILHGS